MSYTLQNFYKSTLSLDWSTGTGTFYVTTKPTISTGWLVTSPNNSTTREIIKYTSTGTDTNGDYVVVSERGVGGTTEQTHTVGEPIRMNITAEYWDAMNDDIAAIVASGVSNANTTTMGGVEIATDAEVDAGTATGGTGASIVLTPANVNASHNIPFVAPGTSGNVMSSNGTDWDSVTLNSLLSTPAFQQLHGTELTTTDLSTTNGICSASNTDGSVLIVYESANVLKRYTRDTNTGMYYITHKIDPTLSITGLPNNGMIIIGSYVYVIYDGGVNFAATRFDLADLANETTMTVPTVTATGTNGVVAWTDGTYAYWVGSNVGTTTVNKWSVSGTTFSAVTTGTCLAVGGGSQGWTSIYDGTNIYLVKFIPGTSYVVIKLADAMYTSATSTTTYLLPDVPFGTSSGVCIAASINSTKMYIGNMFAIWNATAQYTVHMIMSPFTKP